MSSRESTVPLPGHYVPGDQDESQLSTQPLPSEDWESSDSALPMRGDDYIPDSQDERLQRRVNDLAEHNNALQERVRALEGQVQSQERELASLRAHNDEPSVKIEPRARSATVQSQSANQDLLRQLSDLRERIQAYRPSV